MHDELEDRKADFFDYEMVEGLRIQRCSTCHYLPNFHRIACPHCLGPLDWYLASGRGVVETYTIIRRTHDTKYTAHIPIVMALIKLHEGPSLISTIIGDERLSVTIGSTVEVASGARWSSLPQFQLE